MIVRSKVEATIIISEYLDTYPKNDVISFFQKGFCAFWLELGLR